MKRYPHTSPWAPAIGVAAAFATIATMALAIVLPASISVEPIAATAVIAANENPAMVKLDRLEVVAARQAVIDKPLIPATYTPAKDRG